MAAEALKHTVDQCPELETLAAFLDRRLRGGERERVAAHLADCESCSFVFAETAQTHLPTVPGWMAAWEKSRAWLSRSKVIWGSTAAALATASSVWLMVGATFLQRLPTISPELQTLVAAVGPDRTIEPRLTGGFAYAPLRGVVRGGESPAVNVPPDVRIAAARIEKETIAHRTPQSLESLGIAYLVMGDTDRSVPMLEQAADLPSPDATSSLTHARILSDLSAAYLARAARQPQSEGLTKALALTDRAIKADPKLAEALFNRAYALELLSLNEEARQAWRDYLNVDDRSGWAVEARRHLERLASGKP